MTITTASQLRFVPLPGRDAADPFAATDLAAQAGISMRIVELAAMPGRRPHIHPGSAEVVFVAEGRGSLWLDGVRKPLQAGDCVLSPKGTPHATLPGGDTPMRLVCFFPHPDLRGNIEELTEPVT
jgi:quercetin dioxygenase-like cupin family protein